MPFLSVASGALRLAPRLFGAAALYSAARTIGHVSHVARGVMVAKPGARHGLSVSTTFSESYVRALIDIRRVLDGALSIHDWNPPDTFVIRGRVYNFRATKRRLLETGEFPPGNDTIDFQAMFRGSRGVPATREIGILAGEYADLAKSYHEWLLPVIKATQADFGLATVPELMEFEGVGNIVKFVFGLVALWGVVRCFRAIVGLFRGEKNADVDAITAQAGSLKALPHSDRERVLNGLIMLVLGTSGIAAMSKTGVAGLSKHLSCANAYASYARNIKHLKLGDLFGAAGGSPVDEAACVIKLQAYCTSEAQLSADHGNLPVSLCRRVLRPATAALYTMPHIMQMVTDATAKIPVTSFEKICQPLLIRSEEFGLDSEVVDAVIQLLFVRYYGYSYSWASGRTVDLCRRFFPFVEVHGVPLDMALGCAGRAYPGVLKAILRAVSATPTLDLTPEEEDEIKARESAYLDGAALRPDRSTSIHEHCRHLYGALMGTSKIESLSDVALGHAFVDWLLGIPTEDVRSPHARFTPRAFRVYSECCVKEGNRFSSFIPLQWMSTPLTQLASVWPKILLAAGLALFAGLAIRHFTNKPAPLIEGRKPERSERPPKHAAPRLTIMKQPDPLTKLKWETIGRIEAVISAAEALDRWAAPPGQMARVLQDANVAQYLKRMRATAAKVFADQADAECATWCMTSLLSAAPLTEAARAAPAAACNITPPPEIAILIKHATAPEGKGTTWKGAPTGGGGGDSSRRGPSRQRHTRDPQEQEDWQRNARDYDDEDDYDDHERGESNFFDERDFDASPGGGKGSVERPSKGHMRMRSYRTVRKDGATANARAAAFERHAAGVNMSSRGGCEGVVFRCHIDGLDGCDDFIVALEHVVGPDVASEAAHRLAFDDSPFARRLNMSNLGEGDSLCLYPYAQHKGDFGITGDIRKLKLSPTMQPGQSVFLYSRKTSDTGIQAFTPRSGHLDSLAPAKGDSLDLLVHSIYTFAGDSGSPVFDGLTGMVVGVHSFGTMNKGFNAAVQLHKSMFIDDSPVKQGAGIPHHPKIGKIDGYHCFVRGDFVTFDEYEAVIPESLAKNRSEYYYVLSNEAKLVDELNTYDAPAITNPAPLSDMDLASEALLKYLEQHRVRPMATFDKEARFNAAVDAMRTMKSSAGFPCNHGIVDDNGQKAYVQTKAEYALFLDRNPVYRAALLERLFTGDHYWSAFPKIEARKVGKNLRSLVVQPADLFLACHVVCNHLNESIVQLGKSTMSAFTAGWSMLHGGNGVFRSRLQRCHTKGWELYETDFSRFDKKQARPVIDAEYRVRKAMLPLEAHASLDYIMHHEVESKVVYPNGDVHLISNGNKSGSYNTARSNDLRNLLYIFAFTARAFNLTSAGAVLAKFNAHCFYRILGDDGASAWDPQVKARYSPARFADYLARHWGMDLKVGGPYSSPHTVPFLGSTSKVVHVDSVLAEVPTGRYAVPVYDLAKFAGTYKYQGTKRADFNAYYSKICSLRALSYWDDDARWFFNHILDDLERRHQISSEVLPMRLGHADIIRLYLTTQDVPAFESASAVTSIIRNYRSG